MSKSSEQLEKRYKITGAINLLLSFGIHFIGWQIGYVYSLESEQFKIILLTIIGLSLANIGLSIFLITKLSGSWKKLPIIAAVISLFMAASNLAGISL